ncbi:MAG: hypothetical protein HOD63_03220 [Bacteroidetes bacterium]|jgi:hypothetical protein|nr:hypothetical protein [Bacteroidota bacterium]MBT3802087.1 hypothetical protein [Bacteroidota bacterium]MBT4337579.1 hypothetical protein [Bacteroidota bacterium]MBT6836009.1 hypothetical protein [Bacteroidota bacterium]MBT7038945.1 hypothetical protein [Bacteroidota bacterium]
MPDNPRTIDNETQAIYQILFYDAIKPAFELCNCFELYPKNDNSDWNIKSKCNCLTLCFSVAYRELLQNFSDDVDTHNILYNFIEVNAGFVTKVTHQKLSPYDFILLKNKILDDMKRYLDALRKSKYDHIWNIAVLRFLHPFDGKYNNYYEDALKIIITQEKLWIRMFLYNYLDFRSNLEYID